MPDPAISITDDDDNMPRVVSRVAAVSSPVSTRVGRLLALDYTVTDDGFPGALQYAWEMLSGPATPDFADSSSADTSVSFPEAGQYSLRLSAYDGELTATADLVVNVEPANYAPILVTPLANQTTLAGGLYQFTIPAGTFSDADADPLAYSVSNLPAWLSFDPATRTLSGTASVPGHVALTVRATDPASAFAETSFILSIKTVPVITEGSIVSVIMSEDGAPTPFELTLNALPESQHRFG